ncbi:MAG TPA: hypothetical protein DCR61_15360, partial [Verrucomicrobiales bacterium]|nr:hypothetical protein [Verrucomicrobiales bacterium]
FAKFGDVDSIYIQHTTTFLPDCQLQHSPFICFLTGSDSFFQAAWFLVQLPYQFIEKDNVGLCQVPASDPFMSEIPCS